MTLLVNIKPKDVWDRAQKRVSLDLQALRISVAELDNYYDDWALPEYGSELTTALNAKNALFAEFMADLKFAFGSYLTYDISGTTFIVSIEVNDNNMMSEALASAVETYLECRILAWWYTSRNGELAAFNANKAQTTADKLFGFIIPRIGGAAPRYY